MENKQIIIDGVNVRECACIIEDYYYQQANNLANGYKHIKNVCELGESGSEHYNLFCKDNPNCCYKQLKRKEQECEELRKSMTKIFACLIKANRDVIVDTLWVDKITTLWDYIAQTLGIEGDQNQIEEQVKMLYSEGE